MPEIFMNVFGALFEENRKALAEHLEKIRRDEEAKQSFYAGLILVEHRNLFIDNLCGTGLISHQEVIDIVWDTPSPQWAV